MKFYFVPENFVVKDILCFNFGILLFIGGLSSFTIMISKAFDGAALAT